MNIKKYLLIAAIAVISFLVGRFFAPKSESSKQTSHTQTTKNEDVNRNQNVVETTKETTLPDGTVIKEIRKEKETSTQTSRETNTEKNKSLEKTIESRPSYRVGVGYDPAIKGFQDVSYSVTIEKRLFSELYFGVKVDSRHTYGLSLSLGF